MVFRLSCAAGLAAFVLTARAAPTDGLQPRHLFDFGAEPIRGVNIGGWLVIEPFITPSIFDYYSSSDAPVIDEHSLCQKLGKDGCLDALSPHWDSFVTEEDFEKIKGAGFNVIRIPVGYWAFIDVGEGYTSGQVPYLDRAVGWARNQGLKVIIDLHGAPKSQNGFDHSGQKSGQPGWGTGDSINETHEALWQIYQKYGSESMQDVVIGIQPLNEPLLMKLDMEMVKQFYRDEFFTLRETSDTAMVLHDGFVNPDWMNNFLTPDDNGAQGVVVDHHEYTVFDDSLIALSLQERQTLTCNNVDKYRNSDKWTIIGEWSGAITDCAPHLNGYNQKSRFESLGVGNCWGKSGMVSYWSSEYKDDVRRFIETQLDAFESNTRGWLFWNFKTEGSAGEWDLFQLLDNGVFPQPLTDRKFDKYCTNF